MLVSKDVSDSFLEKYKSLMTHFNDGREPGEINAYIHLRKLLFEHLRQENKAIVNIVGNDFYHCLKQAHYGEFIYLKKYRAGYVFKKLDDDLYYQALALTTPLDEIIEDYSVIEVALIPYKSCLICDGLIVRRHILIGKNMAKELREGFWTAKRSGELVTN